MRLPVLPPAPPPPAEDLYEIQERPPVTPMRFVQARNLPPLIVPPRRSLRRGARQHAASEEQTERGEYRGEERRKADRRAAEQNTLLDTRLGRERRHHDAGTDEAGEGVDIEA